MPDSRKTMQMPPGLMPGDPIGIIAPAGFIERSALELGLERIKALGYDAIFLDSIFDRDEYFAGSVDRRVNEIHEMFHRDEVKAILAARGGFGCSYLLPFLDLESIRQHHKPFIGYSDLTTLHTWFNDHGLATFHGPMACKEFAREGGVEMDSWSRILAGRGTSIHRSVERGAEVPCEGDAEGRLYGGCLSLLVESLGTPYAIEPADSILFMEDTGVWPYQVDRMFVHLRMSGKLDRIRGIILGDMGNCRQDGLPEYTVGAIARRVFGDLGIPIVVGLRSGHVEGGNLTLPLGGQVALHAGAEGFTINIPGWDNA